MEQKDIPCGRRAPVADLRLPELVAAIKATRACPPGRSRRGPDAMTRTLARTPRAAQPALRVEASC